ncbi:hypothetical protein GR200_30930 [Rhizobium leguminosarum]|uniref:protein DpdG n=1 Tax=Rhizobium leguminosarum TaxID=384 RepID=UPI0013B9818F|nr:protein DpdG [Rhizobium leguminosarum]NEI59446.1 hypothetical protein [Rhizobium leguminosarum]NEI88286.1 hypothetical protein [Rhizobium leguminosarum]
MTILNQPSDGLYNVLIVLVRNLIRFTPRDEEQLMATCGGQLESVENSHLQRTLIRWTELGLFQSTNDAISIAEPFRTMLGSKHDVAEGRLANVVRTLALHPDNNSRFWDAEGAKSADFSRATAWMLAQDVYTLPQTSTLLEALLNEQLVDPKATTIVQNDTRWNGLRAWMPYLGFARDTSRLEVDPTDALRDVVPEIFGSGSRLIASEFLERMATALPVLDGGKYRREVEGVLKESVWPKPEPGSLSTSLSRALQRLEREGVLQLEQLSDTGEGAALTRRNRKRWRDFSHIRVSGRGTR